MLHATLLASF